MMRREVAANPKKLGGEIIVYPDAQHGFNADYRPSYNKAAAEDAWQKMLAFFQVGLRPSPSASLPQVGLRPSGFA